ncbi:MAG TPA: hypothetical protein VF984_10575 [Actinomycetota bacterium]
MKEPAMRRGVRASLVFAVTLAATWLPAAALGRTASGADGTRSHVGPKWFSGIMPVIPIPDDLAIRFANAALSAGLEKSQAARMLNDDRFALALGSPGQGWGTLEWLIRHPESIPPAFELLTHEGYTVAGADSLQNALMDAIPPLRNAYLKDLGLMAVDNGNGILVLVDLKTGKQYMGHGRLGAQLRAPGGGPLPVPDISPEEAAAQMWAQAELAGGTVPVGSDTIPSGPGLNFTVQPTQGPLRPALATGDEPHHGLLSPGLLVMAAFFGLAWVGFAVKMVVQRLRKD